MVRTARALQLNTTEKGGWNASYFAGATSQCLTLVDGRGLLSLGSALSFLESVSTIHGGVGNRAWLHDADAG